MKTEFSRWGSAPDPAPPRDRRSTARSFLVLACALGAVACAKSDRAPLPGDSVSADGAVALTPARVPVTAPATDARPRADAPSAIERKLFAPELVMGNQAAIGLSAAQRDAIAKETERAHAELLRVQWELDAEKEKLVAVLDAPKVDEPRAKQAAAEVMKREDAIKAGHLAMLVRIKNALTPDQQEKLRALRDASRCAPSPSSSASPSSAPSSAPPRR